MNQTIDSTFVATMAGGPQIVTFALDNLLQRGEVIQEVIVVHLSPQADPLTGQALAKLAAEFPDDRYAGHPCRLRFFPIRRGTEKLDDIRDEAEANAAWSAIHELVASLKAQGRRLHICIAGGRRMLALLTLSAAMLHFDHNDRLWHMYTPAEFIERSRDGAIMHARPEDGVRLIQVPMAPWGAYFPALRALAQATPEQAIAVRTRWLDQAEQARCRAVVEQLTPRQLDVLRAFATGRNPQEVAESLCISLKTVDSHKTVILGECRNAWSVPEDAWLDYHFLRDKFGLFFAGTA
ncbi:MAG: histidine kinase [Chloroflexi bacterium]|nr:MAG: histidine kinase [Chloroflexota bacterium]